MVYLELVDHVPERLVAPAAAAAARRRRQETEAEAS
jgi:hypothetical protein